MAIVRARNPLRWVRRALLALGLLGTAAVALLLAAYKFGKAGSGEAEDAERTANIDERTVTAGEGFDYTQTSEGRPVFRIRAARSRQDRAEWAFLEDVYLEIYRDDGQTTSVTSRRARVNQQNWAAELEGDVVMRGWEHLELRARALELLDGGQQLQSVGAVEFHYPPPGEPVPADLELPPLTGRASTLRIDRRIDTVHLGGGVHIRNVPGAEIPLRVNCDRLVYRRDEGLVRLFEDIFLQYGSQELQTRALSLFMGTGNATADEAGTAAPDLDDEMGPRPGGRGLQMLRARFEVRGRLASGDLAQAGLQGAGGVEFEGQFLEVEPNPDDSRLQRMRLEGEDGAPASVKVVDETGLARRLTGALLESRAVDDQLQVVEGAGTPLVLEEFLDVDPPHHLRQACALTARARFLPDGRLGRIDLENQVELRDEDLYLSGGAEAGLDLERGTLDVRGPAAELFNDRGAITAPHFSYSREKGILHADSGVLALLTDTAAFADTPLGQQDEPVRIEAKEATWTETPPTFSFRGGVRAWQGQNLLLADQLRGDEGDQKLAASGGVSTVWISEPAAGEPLQAPIEIAAERLTYLPSLGAASAVARTLVYDGKVEVKQGRRTIRCRELTAELAAPPGSDASAAGKPQRMICREDVLISDPAARREVRGDTAIYAVAERRIEVFGDTVKLLDEQRNTLVGKYLVYDLDAGTVRLQSRPPAGAGSAVIGRYSIDEESHGDARARWSR